MRRPYGLVIAILAASSIAIAAQGPPGGRGAPQPPRTPRAAAPVDFSGYWVSVVTEDWRWRMVTPARGDFAGVPLNAAARKLGQAWDPAKDEAEGNQCKAYGAAGIMRMPGRLHITWQDDTTLKIDTDQGTQTRVFHFGGKPAPGIKPSWQGYSSANWEGPQRGSAPPDFTPIALNPREGTRGRSLEVVTTNLRAGYLRKNGVPYSENTVLREYFDLSNERNGDTWFVVTTIVEDPTNRDTRGGQQYDYPSAGSGIGNIYVNAKWLFKVSGMYQLPYSVNVSAFYNARQGYPFERFVQGPSRRNGGGVGNVLIDPVGESRLPTFQNLDFHVERPIAAGRVRFVPSLDVFNVSNNNTVQAIRGTQNAANANNIQAIVAPRVLRLGIRFNW